MKIQRFEDIESWKQARELVREVYRQFNSVKDYSFKDQIQRAAISIMTNIAEGFDRGSNKEFIQFLTIARGSMSEVKSLAYSGLDIGYIKGQTFNEIDQSCSKLTDSRRRASESKNKN